MRSIQKLHEYSAISMRKQQTTCFNSLWACENHEFKGLPKEHPVEAGKEEDVLSFLNMNPSNVTEANEPMKKSVKSSQALSLIHISEPTRPLYISYAVFCLKKKKKHYYNLLTYILDQ
eukprot:TRINITY_DN68272_c0_g1_i1.p1 TRINITY_DN68272_c0_g1~~TRINITY_DN68272_c0_g1_i1.p1  ORF type:complete len:118 (+),score=17.32 TRINITY_DN68272_c0_g1_i1:400-753(+)